MKTLFSKLTTVQSTEESQAEQERLVRVVLTMITLCMIPITIIITFFLAAGIFQQIAEESRTLQPQGRGSQDLPESGRH